MYLFIYYIYRTWMYILRIIVIMITLCYMLKTNTLNMYT